MAMTDIPEFSRIYPNLASADLGAIAEACSDDFFAPAARMLADKVAVFLPDKYDDHGKWMDGWETRRCRTPSKTHDWCVIKLATTGLLKGVLIDTSYFTGNYPPQASIDACLSAGVDSQTEWKELLPIVDLKPDAQHYFALSSEHPISHLRLNIIPDGGIARLRCFGEATGSPPLDDATDLAEVSSLLCGGRVIAWNDSHFGEPWVILKPHPARSMQDGWETRRRRTPGYDWLFLRLARSAIIHQVEVDTSYFRGNFPAACSLQGHADDTVDEADSWPYLLAKSSLSADQQHRFDSALSMPVKTIRLCIFPDGGISRLRLFGRFSE